MVFAEAHPPPHVCVSRLRSHAHLFAPTTHRAQADGGEVALWIVAALVAVLSLGVSYYVCSTSTNNRRLFVDQSNPRVRMTG